MPTNSVMHKTRNIMAKYKIGDKVIVKSLETLEEEFGRDGDNDINTMPVLVKSMENYCGKIVTIKHISNDGSYRIKEDNNRCWWSKDVFINKKKYKN